MPPQPGKEGDRDRQVVHDMGQIVQVLEAEGPMSPEELARQVGAESWDEDRFDRALDLTIADGLVLRDADGRLNAM